ncbi:MAG: GIY-YIG nuclease family protein [Desulfobulbaceae bacterium]
MHTGSQLCGPVIADRAFFFMAYFVYILQSATTGRYYIGHTDDLARRVMQHNDPEYEGSKTTKRFSGPWQLVYSEECASRSSAMEREKTIKSWKSRKMIAQLVESRRSRD